MYHLQKRETIHFINYLQLDFCTPTPFSLHIGLIGAVGPGEAWMVDKRSGVLHTSDTWHVYPDVQMYKIHCVQWYINKRSGVLYTLTRPDVRICIIHCNIVKSGTLTKRTRDTSRYAHTYYTLYISRYIVKLGVVLKKRLGIPNISHT